jgi:hypothetical protein
VRERIVAVLPVVIPDTGRPHSAIRHGLNKQENVGLIYRTPSERKGLQHAVDRPLITAEHVAGEWLG